jgi:hypothetical protein
MRERRREGERVREAARAGAGPWAWIRKRFIFIMYNIELLPFAP